MALIADGLLLVAALTAAFYCRILAIRLRRLGHTDRGLGGAISTLNYQVDEMKTTLEAVSKSAEDRAASLERLAIRAEAASRRLELLLAGLHEAEDRDSIDKAAKKVSETLLTLSPDDRVKTAPSLTGNDRKISRSISRQILGKHQNRNRNFSSEGVK